MARATEPDLSEFDAFEAVSMGGNRLRVDLILEELDKNDPDKAEKLRTALTGSYKHRVIAKVLHGWGYPTLTGDSVKSWRERYLPT